MTIAIYPTIPMPKHIRDEIVSKTLQFVKCLLNKSKPTDKFMKELKRITIYVMPGTEFYYPFGARTSDNVVHYRLRGVYAPKKRWIILAQDHKALKWELKNLWNYTEYNKNLIDPNPNVIGIGGCV